MMNFPNYLAMLKGEVLISGTSQSAGTKLRETDGSHHTQTMEEYLLEIN